MAIFLDDQVVLLDGENLGDLLGSAKRRLEADDRVVVEVRIDGEKLDGDGIDRQQTIQISDSEVRLYTAEPLQLAASTLDLARGQLTEARTVQQEASDLVHDDRLADALEKISQVIEIWLQVQPAVLDSARFVGLDLDQITVDGSPVTDYTDELIENLRTLKELIANGDTVGLADVLAYEWPPVVDRWDRVIGRLVEVIEAGGTTE